MVPLEHKFVLSQYAQAFCREFPGVQPGFFDVDSGKYAYHIFICDNEPAGCAIFYNDPEIGYFLDWVWIAKEHRNKGLLRAAWPEFQGRYGMNFWVSTPRSAALAEFLSKYGTIQQEGA